MELGRNVTLGRYVQGDSFVHRMDARLKLVSWVLYALGLFLAGTFSAFALLAFALAGVVVASGISPGYLLRGLKPMLPFLVAMYAFQILFSTSLYPDSTQVWWSWGIFTVTAEGVVRSTLVVLRVLLLYLSVTTLTLTTSLVSLVDGVERLSKPLRRVGLPNQELALAFAISVRFVPTLIEEAEKLMKAQASRGVSMDVGGPITRVRARLPVLVPLILNTLDRSHDLTAAMHARCYRGGDGRTKRRIVATTPADWAALGLMLALFAGALSLKGLGLP